MLLGGNTVCKNQEIPLAVTLLVSGTESQGRRPELAGEDPEGLGEGHAAQRRGKEQGQGPWDSRGSLGQEHGGREGQDSFLSLDFSGTSLELT